MAAHDITRLQEFHREPEKPQEGMMVLADGTDWNPGSGAGFYGYRGGAWVLMEAGAPYEPSVFQVDTVTALTALDPKTLVNGQAVHVLGRNAKNDKGGGTFIWDSSSTTTEDGGTIFQPVTAGTGRWFRLENGFLDPRWFGAYFDGTTDDFAAWALMRDVVNATGKSMHLPEGRTVLSQQVVFTVPIVMIGAGREKTYIRWTASALSVGIQSAVVNPTSQIIVEKLTFERSGAAHGVSGTAFKVNGRIMVGSLLQQVVLHQVTAKGASTTGQSFAVGFDLSEVYGASCQALGYRGTFDGTDATSNKGTGLVYRAAPKADGGNAFGLHLYDSQMWRANICVDVTEAEGTKVDLFEFVAVNTGIKWRPETPGVNQPGVTVSMGHINAYVTGVDFLDASQAEVSGLNIYRRPETTTQPFASIRAKGCAFLRISDNNFTDTGDTKTAVHIELIDTRDTAIGANVFQTGVTGIHVDDASRDITIAPQRFQEGILTNNILNEGAKVVFPGAKSTVKLSASQSIAASTGIALSWGLEVDTNQNDMWARGQPTRLVAPTDGYYRVGYDIAWDGAAGGTRQVVVQKATPPRAPATATPGARALTVGSAAGNWQSSATAPVFMAAGDYVVIEVFQSTTRSLDILSSSNATLEWIGVW
jgi:hypothetical protein